MSRQHTIPAQYPSWSYSSVPGQPLAAPPQHASPLVPPNPRGDNCPARQVPIFNTAPSSTIPQTESVPSNGGAISAQLHDTFGKELAEHTLHTFSSFLEKLLPHERLPFPVNHELLNKLSTAIGAGEPVWNGLRSCFYRPPMIDFGEPAVCGWLNNIGMTMGLVYGRQCERLWWSGRCAIPLVISPVQQKPDLVLLDRCYYDKLSQNKIVNAGWAFVKSVAEVHQPNTWLTETTRLDLTFLCQPHRRFTISLSFFNAKNAQFSVAVTDRVGQICTVKMDLMRPSDENGLLLLSILAFLMFGRPEDVGLDPHFEINPLNGGIVAVECENRRFQVLKRIHASLKLFGRGPQVWIVTHNGDRYIMKDSWVRADRDNEVGHLRRMITHEELKGRVPTLICGGDVVINGIKDSTQRYRTAPCTHYIHRRIVTSPIGESITSFKTKKEFIRVLISIIDTHRYLYNHVGILHRNLNINNILLHRKDNESEVIGLLIDYDYSVGTEHVAEGRVPTAIHRVGTPPFMSIEALLAIDRTFVHKPQHDLESILYIIIFICTVFRGPGLPLRERLDVTHHASPPMSTWFCEKNTREIGFHKLAHLGSHDMAILPYFTPYWCDFAPFVGDLIIACFPVRTSLPNHFQYDQALQILNTAYDSVEESQTSDISPSVPASMVFGAQPLTRTPKRASDALDRYSKRGRQL